MIAEQLLKTMLYWANHTLPSESPHGESALKKPGAEGEAPLPFAVPKRALVIPSTFIGDCVLMTPFLRNLKREMAQAGGSDARLDLMASPVTAPLFETLPFLNGVYYECNEHPLDRVRFLRGEEYDTVFLLRYSWTWAAATAHARVGQRVGFDLQRLGIEKLQRWGNCLTHAISSTSLYDPRPQVEVYLEILPRLGMSFQDNHLERHLRAMDYREPEELLQKATGSPRIVLHAQAGSPGKQWPVEHWSDLLQKLAEEHGDCGRSPVFIAVGIAKEASYYAKLSELSGLPILNACGETTLRESVALLERVDLVVTLDTSMAHLAAMAGTPRLIVLYGPTNHAQWIPRVGPETYLEQVYLNLPCPPCLIRTCGHKSCLRALTANRVFEAIQRSFSDKPLKPSR